jgi:uncharacterized protein YjbI with pentapeptide repeats
LARPQAVVLFLLALAGVVLPHAATAQTSGRLGAPSAACVNLGPGTVAAEHVHACLAAGKRVVLVRAKIEKPLDLTDIGLVRGPFECRRCTFASGLFASDVTFRRTVDLSGSQIGGPFDAVGAIFDGPVLFGAFRGPATFGGDADFTLAVFNDLATFRGATFGGEASFILAKFHMDASFASVVFKKARFQGASFRGTANFTDSMFEDTAVFAGTTFGGRAGFREAKFSNSASFAGSVFRDAADFTEAEFETGAIFDYAQFVSNGSFLDATFTGTGKSVAASFLAVGASGDLDFSSCKFNVVTGRVGGATAGGLALTEASAVEKPRSSVPWVATFFDLASAGTVSFRDTSFESGYSIQMNGISTKDLVMTVRIAGLVADGADDVTKEQQRHVLELIQASAKARGDLSQANDAYYRLRVLVSRKYSLFHRYVVDWPFYREVAGYLVEPLNPLLTLVALMTAFALCRALGGRAAVRRVARTLRRPKRILGALARTFVRFWDTFLRRPKRILGALGRTFVWFWGILGALARTFVRFWDNFLRNLGDILWRRDDASLLRRTEILAYRVLFAVFLIALANSNPTLKQLIEAI